MQLRAAWGAAVRAVEPQHGEERSQRAAPRDQPEHAGKGVSAVSGTYSTTLQHTRSPLCNVPDCLKGLAPDGRGVSCLFGKELENREHGEEKQSLLNCSTTCIKFCMSGAFLGPPPPHPCVPSESFNPKQIFCCWRQSWKRCVFWVVHPCVRYCQMQNATSKRGQFNQFSVDV